MADWFKDDFAHWYNRKGVMIAILAGKCEPAHVTKSLRFASRSSHDSFM